jgi:hypothetical protein
MAGTPIDPETKRRAVALEYWALTVIVGGAILFTIVAGIASL